MLIILYKIINLNLNKHSKKNDILEYNIRNINIKFSLIEYFYFGFKPTVTYIKSKDKEAL